ncbi:hypothetical protein F5Y10DRAFT_266990 [Nemania abortiva]|nr:hypothetical protein F5Y10DRAFT_266990 [Nemania abortiva]
MSEYVDNFDFNALMHPNEEAFDFSFLNDMAPIGQDEVAAYKHNAGYGPDLDAGVGIDPAIGFNVPMALGEEVLDPGFFANMQFVGQYGPAAHETSGSDFDLNTAHQPSHSFPPPPAAIGNIDQS